MEAPLDRSCTFARDVTCHTASWYLIRDQLIIWALIQTPIILLSFLYQIVNIHSQHIAIQKCRQCLSTYIVQFVNSILQLVGSIYVIFYWISRAAVLSVDLSSYAVESIFMFLIVISYIFRWLAAKNKFKFCLQAYCLFDILSITSHFTILYQTTIVENKVVYSWLDFGFLRSYILYAYFGSLFAQLPNKTFVPQMTMVVFQFACLIFFVSAMLFSIEVLGELPNSNTFLFHVYLCQDNNGRIIRTDTIENFDNCEETWSLLTAFYFMLVTVSTVGYGDFSPSTVLGRFVITIIIVIGIYMFANETSRLVEIYNDHRSGRHSYTPSSARPHVVIIGDLSDVQMKDFIREFFHPDHEVENQPLQDIVVMIDCEDEEHEAATFESIRSYSSSFKRFRHRVVLLSGSPLDEADLLRAQIHRAEAVFVIPNKYERDVNAQDAASVLRILSISNKINAHAKIFAMVLNSDNTVLFEATGINPARLIASDAIKMTLMGISCRCPAFSTLMANLISSRSGSECPDVALPWLKEYLHGAANEIYASTIHSRYWNKTFMEAVVMIHRETDGQVLPIGAEDGTGVFQFNPGHRLLIDAFTKVYLICESTDTISNLQQDVQSGQPMRHSIARSGTMALLRARGKLLKRAVSAQHAVERRIPKEVEEYVELHDGLSCPQSPPMSVLENDHIIVCSNHVAGDQQALSRMCKFLQPLRSAHVQNPEPVVIIDPVDFHDITWAPLLAYKDVYHVKGDPLRLSTLYRAGIEKATAIVILAHGDTQSYNDSRAIFNTILVDSATEDNPQILKLLELTDVFNNKYLDPVNATTRAMQQTLEDSRSHSFREGNRIFSQDLLENKVGVSYTATQIGRVKRVFFLLKDMLLHADYSGDTAEANDMTLDDSNDIFFQDRYVSGALFPSFVADDLLIQSFFNPGIVKLVTQLTTGSSCFVLYSVPKAIMKPGLRYGELFAYMTAGVSSALPIGLYRAPTRHNASKQHYVFTSPFSHTIVHELDLVFVVIDQYSLSKVASKVQKAARWLKTWGKGVKEVKNSPKSNS